MGSFQSRNDNFKLYFYRVPSPVRDRRGALRANFGGRNFWGGAYPWVGEDLALRAAVFGAADLGHSGCGPGEETGATGRESRPAPAPDHVALADNNSGMGQFFKARLWISERR